MSYSSQYHRINVQRGLYLKHQANRTTAAVLILFTSFYSQRTHFLRALVKLRTAQIKDRTSNDTRTRPIDWTKTLLPCPLEKII